jgi:sugar phosphate isomerase/epimerase
MEHSRRDWLLSVGSSLTFAGLSRSAQAGNQAAKFKLRYVLASSLYGTTAIAEVLPEVKKSGAEHIDLWPQVHANHREQVDALGEQAFAELLIKNGIQLGMTTRYDLGPFGLASELAFVNRMKGRMIVTGAERGKGATTKEQMQAFVDRLQPTAALAEKHGVTVAIENHSGMLLNTLDAIRWFAEMIRSPRIGVALAPAHLPQDSAELAKLVEDLGPKLVHFYAWQTGDGFLTKLPKEQELKQLPGRGPLDFRPLLAALGRAHYDGWIEIFMHPTPRGIPILDTTAQVTEAVNEARAYLEQQFNSIR